jgi:hypothetical protein
MQCRCYSRAHTWDSLGEGRWRIQNTQGACEHAAALGQRHQLHENAIAGTLLGHLWRAGHAQIPAQSLCTQAVVIGSPLRGEAFGQGKYERACLDALTSLRWHS